MLDFLCPMLYIASFLGTKFLGLDRTVSTFKLMGKVLGKNPFLSSSTSLAFVRTKIDKGYRLVPFPIQCLDQAIVNWFLLNLYHHSAKIQIGMRLDPLASHAWVECEGELFGELSIQNGMTVITSYSPWRIT